MKTFFQSAAVGFAGSFFVTERLAVRDKNGVLAMDPKERQLMDAGIATLAFVYGLQKKDSKILGIAFGIASAVALRLLTNCSDLRDETCAMRRYYK